MSRMVSRVMQSRTALLALIAATLSLGACDALRHDRGSAEPCYCASDLNSAPATVGHTWRL